jgi:hypothetical protein
MSFIVQVAIGLLSFSIGMAAVGSILQAKGLLVPALRVLKDQRRMEFDVELLESTIAEKEREIVVLKKRLKKLKGSEYKTILDDSGSLPMDLKPQEDEDPSFRLSEVRRDEHREVSAAFDQKPNQDEVASLDDMNKRLQQISLLIENLPSKLSDVLRLGVNDRGEKLNLLDQAVDAIKSLSTLNQNYIDSVLRNASSKSEELEIKSAILKMKSARSNMFQVANFVSENKAATLTGNVMNDFKVLLNIT